MATYIELLKDPRWQRMRLEILQRADFKCERCDSDTRTLHVHHQYYEKGLKPWEYDASTLCCLCEDCHAEIQLRMSELQRTIGSISYLAIDELYGFAMSIVCRDDAVRSVGLWSYEAVVGLAKGLGVSSRDVLALEENGRLSAESVSRLIGMAVRHQ